MQYVCRSKKKQPFSDFGNFRTATKTEITADELCVFLKVLPQMRFHITEISNQKL